MRKLLKRIAAVLLALVGIIAIGILIVILTIDKEWIETRLQTSLSRRVSIGQLNTQLLSPISGFQVKDLRISNRLSPQQLAVMKPIKANNLFVRARFGRLKLSLLPLLRRKLIIREVVLHQPQLHIIRFSDGRFNFSDLLNDEESFFKQITIATLRIKDGQLSLTDRKTSHLFSLNDFSLNGVYQEKPAVSEREENLNFTSRFKFKSRHLGSASFARSVDIDFRIDGIFQSMFTPEAPAISFDLNIHTVEGRIKGFKIWERIKSLPLVRDYLDGLSFLAKEMVWKKGKVRLIRKEGTIRLTDGEIRARDHSIRYNGQFRPASNQMAVELQFTFPREYQGVIRKHLLSQTERLIPERILKNIDRKELVENMISPLVNQQGQIFLMFALRGTPAKPKVTLIKPSLHSFSRVFLDLAKKKITRQGQSLLDKLMKKVLNNKGRKNRE
jgi:hypothetical protein